MRCIQKQSQELQQTFYIAAGAVAIWIYFSAIYFVFLRLPGPFLWPSIQLPTPVCCSVYFHRWSSIIKCLRVTMGWSLLNWQMCRPDRGQMCHEWEKMRHCISLFVMFISCLCHSIRLLFQRSSCPNWFKYIEGSHRKDLKEMPIESSMKSPIGA